MESFEIEVKLTKGDIIEYNFMHIRWLLLLDIIAFIILIVGVYISIIYPDRETRETLGMLAFWWAAILAVGLSQPFVLIMQILILKSPAVEKQMMARRYILDSTGIHIKSDERDVNMPWAKIEMVRETRKIVLIYTNPKLAYIVPKRYFSSKDEMNRFILFLSSKIGKDR